MAEEITSATPSSGTVNGGQTVTIRGSGFSGAEGVLFGGSASPLFVVDDDETITAVTPAHASGLVDITILLPD